MIEHSEKLDELATALAKAQTVIATAKRDSQNPFFKSSYADLASVWEACRDALTSNGLSVAQFPGFKDGIATVDTILLHSSGQWLQATAGAPIAKQDAQGVGSALTYLRRYALAAVASVSPADDDGNAAVGHGGKSPAASKGASARTTSAPVVPMPPAPTESLEERPRAIIEEEKAPPPWSAQARTWKGKPLGGMPSADLLALRKFGVKKGPEQFPHLVEQVDEVLAAREGL
jgi:ERF superfamily protein